MNPLATFIVHGECIRRNTFFNMSTLDVSGLVAFGQAFYYGIGLYAGYVLDMDQVWGWETESSADLEFRLALLVLCPYNPSSMRSDESDAFLKTCGREFRKAREFRKLSREALAERAGVHPNTIGVVERGQRDLNGLTQTKLFAALGCAGIRVHPSRFEILLDLDCGAFSKSDILKLPDPRIIGFMGDAVRQRRIACGLRLDDIAALTDLHRNTVWNYERGLVSPSGYTVYLIFRALNVSFVLASVEGIVLE